MFKLQLSCTRIVCSMQTKCCHALEWYCLTQSLAPTTAMPGATVARPAMEPPDKRPAQTLSSLKSVATIRLTLKAVPMCAFLCTYLGANVRKSVHKEMSTVYPHAYGAECTSRQGRVCGGGECGGRRNTVVRQGASSR